MKTKSTVWQGLIFGFIGVACFSLTVPFTKLALRDFSPYFITVGRVMCAGILASFILLVQRQPLPKGAQWKNIFLVSLGISLGFPLCLSMALVRTEASHAGIVLAILPLLTALMGAYINHERHSAKFWTLAASGCLTVLVYIVVKNGIVLVPADSLLLLAALSAALAYSVGAKLSKALGGLQTICWALVVALPISVPTGIYFLLTSASFASVPMSSFAAFLYLAFISQLLGFVPWYAGLRLGGIARVSQVQLLQTFLTLFATAFLLHENIPWHVWAMACVVLLQVYASRERS